LVIPGIIMAKVEDSVTNMYKKEVNYE